MNMAPSDIPKSYTHVHFAFANITSDFEVDVSGLEDVFQEFLETDGFNRVLSFGGWAFSTDPSTFPIFRSGVTDANRLSFARNVANFVQSYNLQGVDFDWEYPGPSIIPGIPSGSPEDGVNYQEFLSLLRGLLPSTYSVSITAPASYYYLQNFPIYNMSQIVDYIVFMTYDMHGQWDYGNVFTDPGCPAGGCLRSQINMTETQSAFSMITKAGVPANMIMVGQPLYGRSFQMSEAGCYTEECTFTGPNSGALAGPCTGTPGYIGNWEIDQIISNSQYESSVQEYSSNVAGDILVYDSTQWISWMKPSTYNSRSEWVQGLNFGGTCDWAMDLNASYAPNGTPIGEGSGVVYISPDIYSSASPTVTCLPPCTFVFPPWTLSTMTTITIPATTMSVEEIWPSVSTLTNGVTTTLYVTATTVTTITLPPITTDTISIWNIEWTNSLNNTLYLTSSIVPPAITLTESPTVKTTGTSTTTLAGIIYTYAPGPYPPLPIVWPPIINPPPGYTFGHIPAVVGPPGPPCLIGCGGLCLINCSPGISCIICGCIGLGCPGGGGCVGPSCSGGEDDGGGDDDESTTCATSSTVQDCEVGCSITNYEDTSFATNCFTTACSKVVGCQTEGTTTTTETTTAACALSTVAYPTWTPVAGGQLPILGTDNSWTTPGVTVTSATSATSTPPTTTKSSTTTSSSTSAVAPSSASPSEILFFTDTKVLAPFALKPTVKGRC
jgi:chitinase